MQTTSPVEIIDGFYLNRDNERPPVEYDSLDTGVNSRFGEVALFFTDGRHTAAEVNLGDARIRAFHPYHTGGDWRLERVDDNVPQTVVAEVPAYAPMCDVLLAIQRLAADEHVAVVERVIDALFDNIELAGLAEDALLSEHAAPVTDDGKSVYATTLTYADADLPGAGRGVILSFNDGAEVRVSITLHRTPIGR